MAWEKEFCPFPREPGSYFCFYREKKGGGVRLEKHIAEFNNIWGNYSYVPCRA
jgi:hypothetical protein